MTAIVNCVTYAAGRRVESIPINAISAVLKQPDRFIWIGLYEPDEDLLTQIQGEFGLHDLAVEDAHHAHQRPKVEIYGNSLFIVLRTAQINAEECQIDFGETHIFVGVQYLVSIRHGSSLSYADVRTRCESMPRLLQQGPGFALYALMDAIVDQYFPVIDTLEHELQKLEDQIFGESFSRKTTAQIYGLKRELLELKYAVAPLTDMCARLLRIDLDVLPVDTREYFRDVHDHVLRINEMVDTLRELLGAALDANFSLIAIDQNDVMKRFAGWAAIFAVPTMVAGVYGMNFVYMPELTSPVGYPFVLCVIIGGCILLYSYFRRSGWL
jgi:magnesium transporter